MPSAYRVPAFFALVLASLVATSSSGQSPDAESLRDKFRAERDVALKAKFPPETLARADDLAKRGEAALEERPQGRGAILPRRAWQLPYLPAGLPDHVVRVFGESRMRHADRVNALSYSPDGMRLASASRDGTAKVWDLETGREIATYRGHLDQPGRSYSRRIDQR